jgi:hypothetical protein
METAKRLILELLVNAADHALQTMLGGHNSSRALREAQQRFTQSRSAAFLNLRVSDELVGLDTVLLAMDVFNCLRAAVQVLQSDKDGGTGTALEMVKGQLFRLQDDLLDGGQPVGINLLWQQVAVAATNIVQALQGQTYDPGAFMIKATRLLDELFRAPPPSFLSQLQEIENARRRLV